MYATTTITAAAAAFLAALPSVTAHGYVTNAIINGQTNYIGSILWWYQSTKPAQAVWYALDQDSGFVAPDSYSSPDIICHKSATPGSTYITVAAGSTFGLQWNTWPLNSHWGPVLNYLAPVSGDWSAIDKTKLEFFAIQTSGLINDDTPPGYWATDVLSANNYTGQVTIPASLAPGNYVLRHEIIALHGAENANGAQNYPQCVNVKVTGTGTAVPSTAAGADIRVGTSFYTPTDPGILFNVYNKITSYPIPGLALWSGAGGSTSTPPKSSSSPVSTPQQTSTLVTSSKPATTTSTKAASSTSSTAPAASCAAKYAQCGGQGWTGATCCVAGSTCKASGQYYSQCS